MSVERFVPSGPLRGTLTVPPDKSISHRAALIAAMGDSETTIHNYLDSADTQSTLTAIQRLGAELTGLRFAPDGEKRPPSGRNRPRATARALELRIRGVGLRGARSAEIDVGNAGTLLRLLPGWLAGQPAGEWTLDGDESIRRRPVDRIAQPLAAMGARVACRDEKHPPLRVEGARLHGIEYRLPVASAQVKSCLLFAGLLAEGETALLEPAPSRDHTERMLMRAGAAVETRDAGTSLAIRGALPARRITVRPAERLEPGELVVPGDLSSAAFFLVAALIVPGSEVRLENVGVNPYRVGLLGILNRMGAAIEVIETAAAGAEPRATLVARHGPLTATRIGGGEVPLAIDELPLVALAGCYADGETVLSGAEELRHKESDRIATVVEGLRGLGAEIEATEDGFAVEGGGGLRGGMLDSNGDHRLAMLGAVAGLASREGVEVRGMEAAAVSYPNFGEDLHALLRPG